MIKNNSISFMILLLFCSCKPNPSSSYQTIKGYAQGGTYQITYSQLDSLGNNIKYNADDIYQISDSILRQIDTTLSGYNKLSITHKINIGATTAVPELFKEMFDISVKLYHETDGLIDVSGAPLFDIWGFGFKNGQMPSDAQIDSVLQFVGMDKIKIAPGCNIIKSDPRVQLNFNAIAQGFSCDIIAKHLERLGICNYFVEVGMEIYCKGLNSKGEKWKIGIEKPIDGNMVAGSQIQDILAVSDCGIVTSGNYRKFYVKNGKKYSHTINPKTGRPVDHNLLSATVIAPDATLADAYATYCMVLGVDNAIKFIKSRKELECYLIYEKNGKLETYNSYSE